MDRRGFLTRTTATGAAVLGGAGAGRAAAEPASKARKKGQLKAGHQHYSSDPILRVLAALGINHICSALPSRTFDQSWSVEGLTKLRERVESFGIKLDMVPLPLSNSPVGRAENPNILLGKSPGRDKEIDQICQMIRNAARAGIPAVKYNLTILGVVRTANSRGRGGARYSTFEHRKAEPGAPPRESGPVDDAAMWDRITYFLKRVVPVAEECKVRLCCHPHDPAMPAEGYHGVACVLGSVDGLKRFVDIAPSPYHGLNFCQGSVCEMLKDPNKEIDDVIRYFGTKNRIFNVHFRNIKGGFLNFQETFPDDGDVDMLRALRVYREVGYDGMIMPDHVPHIDGDAGGAQAFAFAFGYIQALIQLVNNEA